MPGLALVQLECQTLARCPSGGTLTSVLGAAQIASSGPWAWSFLIGFAIALVVSAGWTWLLVRALRRRRAGLWPGVSSGRRQLLRRPVVALGVGTVVVGTACWAPLWPYSAPYHQWRLAHGGVYYTRRVSVDTGRSHHTYTVATMGDQRYALVANSSGRHIVSGDYLTMRCERVPGGPSPFSYRCRVSADTPEPAFAAFLDTQGLDRPPG